MSTKTNRKKCLIVTILMLIGLLGTASLSLGAGDTWTQKTDMPTARISLATRAVNGKIYAIGGYAGAGAPPQTTVEEYDPRTDTWTIKAPMPIALATLSSSVVNDKIYAMGGFKGMGASLATMEMYDPVTDTWTQKADMPTARNMLSTSAVDGKIYAIGGARAAWADFYQTVEAYDPQTDTWTKKADMPTPRAFLSTAAVDGKIYAIGGALVSQTYISTVEEYDPTTDTWTRKADMPTPRGVLCTAVVNGKIYAIGGGTTSVDFSAVEVYDPATDTWTIKADMPVTRAFLSTSAGVVGGRIYVIGGSVSGGGHPGVRTVYEYDTGLTVASPDFNGDGTVDIQDLLRLIESWGQDDPLCDIAPPPFRDGIIDTMDLELLMGYWEQPVDDPTLIAHWALDEAEGEIAYDSAGVNDASVIGESVWLPEGGKVGGALALDGIDGCVVTDTILSPAAGAFSVFAWVQGGMPGQVVISQIDGANWLGLHPSSGCLMTNLHSSGRSGSPLHSEIMITDGLWHRIGFVWDGLYRSLYVDDILVAEDTQEGLRSSVGGLNIGTGKAMEAGTYWSGLIDDIRIYNRVVIP